MSNHRPYAFQASDAQDTDRREYAAALREGPGRYQDQARVGLAGHQPAVGVLLPS